MPQDSSSVPRSRRWRKRYLLAIPIAAIALSQWISASARNSGLARLRASGFPTTVAALDLWYASVTPDDNLAGPLMRAAQGLRFKADSKAAPIPYVGGMRDDIPDSPVPPETRAHWRTALTANQEAWPALAEARSRNQSRYPINLTQGYNTVLSHLTPIKQLAQACALRALIAAEEGKTDESTEALRDLLLCRRSLLPEPILISSLVGFAMDGTTGNAMAQCFSRIRFTEPQLAAIGEDLRQIASSNHIERALVGETLMGATAFNTPPQAVGVVAAPTGTAANLPGNLLFAALKITGVLPADEAFYLRSMETMLGACQTLDSTSLDRADQLQNDINAALAAPTGKLKIYSRMLLPALAKAIHKAAEAQARLRLAQTAVAIERYRRAHNNQPPTELTQLVPTYLPAVLSDPFDNKPLRYAVKGSGYLLHSIGPDRIDQNGEAAPKTKGGQTLPRKDLVLEVKR